MRHDAPTPGRPPDGFLPPPAQSRQPRRPLPPGATDCHAHVFGPFDRFPLAPERHYTPAELPGARYLRMLDETGLSRGVLVQGGAHGTDCRAMLDALDQGGGRLRGVALAGAGIDDATLADMDARGVRALRFSRGPAGPGPGAIDFGTLPALAPRMAALGWHVQVQDHAGGLVEVLPSLLSHGMDVVIDHMALVDPTRGAADPVFTRLLRFLERERVWFKLTPYRASRLPPAYDDMRPFHLALLSASPDRLLWGSDWPHVHLRADMPEVGSLLDLLAEWTDDAHLLRRILVDNPAALFGF